MKKWLLVVLVFSILALGACSSNSDQSAESADNSSSVDRDMANTSEQEIGFDGSVEEAETGALNNQSVEPQPDSADSKIDIQNRKVIYNANLSVEVTNYNESFNSIQSDIQNYGGYIVESSTYGAGRDNDLQEGRIQVRIPQEHFHDFVALIEQGSMKVLEKNLTGQDVTEEFVDLESRLKSKRVVEERLLSFMNDAEKTEDLLKISNDLAKVQEEIEQITGRINYLQNQTDLATITIHIRENKVTIPELNKEDLNTWEKTKQQFFESVNLLISAASAIVIFIVGNLPILAIIAIVGFIVYRIIRKNMNNNNQNE